MDRLEIGAVIEREMWAEYKEMRRGVMAAEPERQWPYFDVSSVSVDDRERGSRVRASVSIYDTCSPFLCRAFVHELEFGDDDRDAALVQQQLDSLLAAVTRHFGSRRFMWWNLLPISSNLRANAAVEQALRRHGFEPDPENTMICMQLDIAAWMARLRDSGNPAVSSDGVARAVAPGGSGSVITELRVREVPPSELRTARCFTIVYRANYLAVWERLSPEERIEHEELYMRLMSRGKHRGWRHFEASLPDGTVVASSALHCALDHEHHAFNSDEARSSACLRHVMALHHVAVEPSFQRRGFGSAIVRAVLQRAGEATAELAKEGASVVLQADPPGVGLYRREGFVDVHEIPTYYHCS